MIIDAHIHLSENYEALLSEMDRTGVYRALLTPVSKEKEEATFQKLNNNTAALVRERRNILGFASVHPETPGASEELERAIKRLGLVGLKTDPNIQRFRFDNDSFWSVLETVKIYKIPVMVESYRENNSYFDAEEINETVTSFPDIPFIFTHLGGQPETGGLSRILPEKNVYLETSLCSKENLKIAMDVFEGRLIYGSNFQSNKYPQEELDKVKKLHAPPEEKADILGGNIARILNIDYKNPYKEGWGEKVSGLLGRLKR